MTCDHCGADLDTDDRPTTELSTTTLVWCGSCLRWSETDD